MAADDYRSKDPDDYLDLAEGDTPEELDSQVQKARAELEDLRRRQEQIEKEKLRLEELSRRQDELEQGRAEMCDRLTRALGVVQREGEETEKKLEQLNAIHASFTEHLKTLDGINPKLWTTSELPKELSRALSAVDDARSEYTKAQVRIEVDLPEETAPASSAGEGYDYEGDFAGGERGFAYWLKSGVAFTLPLQILGLIALAIWFWSLTAVH